MTMVSVEGADFGKTGIPGLAAGWTLNAAYSNVTISAHLNNGGGAEYVSEGSVYLMSSIGPGTTTAQQLNFASFSLPPQYDGMFTLFSGLSLPAGNYWIVFSVPSSPFSYASWVVSNPATVSTAGDVTFLGSEEVPGSVASYPPASTFIPTSPGTTGFQYQFSVTGVP